MRPQPQPRYLLRWRRMSVERSGGDCLKNTLIIYTLFFWVSGFALIFLGLWMVLDPKRNYILELVNFSEDDPLLTFAAYVAIVAGCCTLLVGFLGCCGAVKRMRFILACVWVKTINSENSNLQFIISLALICIADIAIATLALVYRNKFSNNEMEVYLKNLTYNRYSRDKWVEPLLDTIQFYDELAECILMCCEAWFGVCLMSSALIWSDYKLLDEQVADAQTTLRRMVKFEYGVSHEIESNRLATTIIDKLQFHEKCCGALSPSDYIGSRWEASVLANTMYDEPQDRPLVPVSCCTQIAGASALNPLAKSLARCQQLGATKQWRHAVHQCCGGASAEDYHQSFWFITNTLRGTRSYVPPSCCKQAQLGRAWAPLPIDPMCTTYKYSSTAFQTAVNYEGCHEKLQSWFNEQVWIFVGVGFGFALFMMLGMILATLLCSKVRYYYHVKEDDY